MCMLLVNCYIDILKGLRLFQWQGWTGLLAFMIAEGLYVVLEKWSWKRCFSECPCHIAILQLRIYALYSLNKKLLAVMLMFYVACSGCSAWIVITELSSITGMDLPQRAVLTSQSDFFFFCYQVTAPILPTDVSYCLPLFLPRGIFRYWIPMLSFECLLCVLVLFQGFQRFRSDSSIFRSGKRLVSALIRDSIVYFLVCVFFSFLFFPHPLIFMPFFFRPSLKIDIFFTFWTHSAFSPLIWHAYSSGPLHA